MLRHLCLLTGLFIFTVGGLQAADPLPGGVGASFQGPLGVQLYSLRGILTLNAPQGLQQIRDFGFTNVELAGTYGQTPEKFQAMLSERGLKPISGHWPYDRWKNEPAKVIAEAKVLGVRYAGCAWIAHQPPFGEAAAREATGVFGRAGEIAAAAGIRFFYHCHGYEFQPYREGTFMDLLLQETNPRHVGFEMDVLWVVLPGQNPVDWLKRYPGRWELMHLKDLKRGVPTDNRTGKTDLTNDVPLGTGQIDWPAVLKAAQETGVKFYFVEDESPSVVEQIPQTLRYLQSVKW